MHFDKSTLVILIFFTIHLLRSKIFLNLWRNFNPNEKNINQDLTNKFNFFNKSYVYEFIAPNKSLIHFRISKKGFQNQIFDFLAGISKMTTGDSLFDSQLKVNCHSLFFIEILKKYPEVRKQILQIFEMGLSAIDAEELTVIYFTSQADIVALQKLINKLNSDLNQIYRAAQKDVHFSKHLKLEQKILSASLSYRILQNLKYFALSFAFATLVLLWLEPADLIIEQTRVILYGFIFSILCLLIYRIIVISSILSPLHRKQLMVAPIPFFIIFPFVFGTGLISDFNRRMDNSVPQTICGLVDRSFKERSIYGNPELGDPRSRRFYRYFLPLKENLKIKNLKLPKVIEISEKTYQKHKYENQNKVCIEISQGRLGFAWYKNFEFQ